MIEYHDDALNQDDTASNRSSNFKDFHSRTQEVMISYAQNFEDVILRRALSDVDRGFYIDIGAFHPVIDNVTKWFHDIGWRGINVEPNLRFYDLLVDHRPDDINLRVAVASCIGSVRLILLDGLSTIVTEVANSHSSKGRDITATAEVPAITLDELFDQYVGSRIVDFLKIDVEQAEGPILISCKFEKARPRILVVEAVRPDSEEGSWDDWEPHILKCNYEFAWFDGLNRFYVRCEDSWRARLMTLPPNVHDRFLLSPTDYRISTDEKPRDLGSLVFDLENTRNERDQLRAEVESLSNATRLFERVAPAAVAHGEVKQLSLRLAELHQQVNDSLFEVTASKIVKEENDALRVSISAMEQKMFKTESDEREREIASAYRSHEIQKLEHRCEGLGREVDNARSELIKAELRLANFESEQYHSIIIRCEQLSSALDKAIRDRINSEMTRDIAVARLVNLELDRDRLNTERNDLLHELEGLLIKLAQAEIKMKS